MQEIGLWLFTFGMDQSNISSNLAIHDLYTPKYIIKNNHQKIDIINHMSSSKKGCLFINAYPKSLPFCLK
jgi:hypothetical protein